ncbi:uncharacterized protein DSM5745_02349 [Aspergillus mulundensis]|uniref:Uncharacterized protein n=1 Tax=Aspergillus mulundensis TaxID=1810919 RepID=A0A3D8SWB8_9EURO|nr:hypothetical protein DSM5745_02349 [Aspergillus mulundensis]RDW90574.1 hypothetical protein DSM5745_02349 [Aspergillus mulundensis]
MNSIKIPWGEVAKSIGHNISEGAIVQHLAKIRARRIEANKEVPPALRRGSCGSYAKTARTTTATSYKKSTRLDEASYSSDEEWLEHRASAQRKAGEKRKRTRAQYREDPYTECGEFSDDDDSEIVAAGASFLELPNDRHTERPQSPTPHPPSKIVTYKCPKPFLIGLAKGIVSRASTPQKPTLAPELYLEGQLKKEPMEEKPDTEKRSVRMEESFEKHEPFESDGGFQDGSIASTALFPTPSDYSHDFAATTDNGNHAPLIQLGSDANATFPPRMQEEGEYIHTGNKDMDLFPGRNWDAFLNGWEILNAFPDHDILTPHQGVQYGQDQGFQDTLGDYPSTQDDPMWLMDS